MRMLDRENQLELNLDRPYRSQWIDYDTPGKRKIFPMPPRVLDDPASPINPQRMFIEAILAGRKPMMDGEAGRRDLAVIVSAYRSAESGKPQGVKCNRF